MFIHLCDAIETSWLFQIEPVMVVHAYNPSTYEARGWRVPGWPGLKTFKTKHRSALEASHSLYNPSTGEAETRL